MIIWRGEGMRNREDVVLFGPGMKGEGDHEKRQFSRRMELHHRPQNPWHANLIAIGYFSTAANGGLRASGEGARIRNRLSGLPQLVLVHPRHTGSGVGHG